MASKAPSSQDRIDRLLFSLSSLSDIGETLTSSGDFTLMLRALLRQALGMLAISKGALLLHDRTARRLLVGASSGLGRVKPALNLQDGWESALIAVNRPVFRDELESLLPGLTTTGRQTLDALHAHLWAPLVVQRRLVGVLSVSEHFQKTPYEPEDLVLLGTIARSIAVGLYNQSLIEETKAANLALNQKVMEMETLYDVGMAMTSDLDIDTLTDAVLIRLATVLALRSGFLALTDGPGQPFRIVASFGLDPTVIDELCKNEIGKRINDVITRGVPRILNDRGRESGRYPWRHLMLIPLWSREATLGVLGAMDRESRETDVQPFVDGDLRLASAFANQAGVAIANARLYRRILDIKNYNQNILTSISSGVVTTNLDGTVVSMNRAAARVFDADVGDFLNRSWNRLTDHLDGGDIPALIQSVQDTGREAQRSQVACRISEIPRVLDIRVSPLFDQDGGVSGLVIVLDDLSEENRIRNIFKRYVSGRIVDLVLHPERKVTLGGEIREIVVVFTDLRGFTQMQEEQGPEEMVATLNEYFHEMVEVISHHNGTLSRIEGDGLMILYGAPIALDDEMGRAMQTVLDMRTALDRLNEHRILNGKEPLGMGIGLASGRVLAGNIGSYQRMEYTVIGDPVNLAARLVDIAASGQILVSEDVFMEIRDRFHIELFRTIRIKGKQRPVNVYELKGKGRPPALPATVQSKEPDPMKKQSTEVDLTIPLLPEMELAASRTAAAIAEFMRLDHNKVEEIRLALIEACVNAIEHSKSKDQKGYINFIIQDDQLEITLQDFGEGFDVDAVRHRLGERDPNRLLKRGWGLKIMEELMDSVEVQSGRKGTTIRMIKRR